MSRACYLLGSTHSGILFGDLQMSVLVFFSLGLISFPGVESSNLLSGECKPGDLSVYSIDFHLILPPSFVFQ